MQKVSKHHISITQDHIKSQSTLQQINWLVLIMNPEDHDDLTTCNQGTALKALQAHLMNWLNWWVLLNLHPDHVEQGVPCSFMHFNHHSIFNKLNDFKSALRNCNVEWQSFHTWHTEHSTDVIMMTQSNWPITQSQTCASTGWWICDWSVCHVHDIPWMTCLHDVLT